MITTLDIAPHVLAMRIDGHVETDDIARAFRELEDRSSSPGELSLYLEIESLSGVKIDAVLTDVRLGGSHLDSVRRMQRVAIVSDIDWLVRGIEWGRGLVPQVDVRTFPGDHTEQARIWIVG